MLMSPLTLILVAMGSVNRTSVDVFEDIILSSRFGHLRIGRVQDIHTSSRNAGCVSSTRARYLESPVSSLILCARRRRMML